MKVIETICEWTYKQGQLIVGFSMYVSQVYSSGSLPYIIMYEMANTAEWTVWGLLQWAYSL